VVWSSSYSIRHGAFIGFLCWLGFIATTLFAETTYEKRPFKLYAINTGYWLTALLISGAVLAVWR
jgi:hypothetical protein